MNNQCSLKLGVAAAVLLGLGLATAGAASAATDDDEGKGKGLDDEGVRHGVRYEGCRHFELVDPDALESWAMDNSWHFAQWVTRLDELRANPEPAIVDAMTMLFPECPWPPPPATTFGPQRNDWTEAMASATEAAADFDLAGDPTGASPPATAARLFARVLALGLRAQRVAPAVGR